MPARLRAVVLRADMERVTGCAAEIREYPNHLRVSVPAPADQNTMQALLEVVQSADFWGSSDGTGQLRVWAGVTAPKSPPTTTA
jgi:hypothetical protein